MNKRIQALAIQSIANVRFWEADKEYYDVGHDELEKFAELIVRECVGIIAKRKDQAIDDGWNVDEAMSMAEMDLEDHFGIK